MTPSATILSGDDPWITVDGAVSNELFYADHMPMRLDNVTVTLPDGTTAKPENAFTGKYRSVFDVHLTQPGTYRIANVNAGLSARFKQGGQDRFWRGPAADFKGAIPADATDVQVSQNASRTETFVTRGAPTTTALKPTGQGLELVPVTHPNDLVAGETASFKLLLDGQPAAGVDVTVLPGASRYRQSPGEMKATTGADGAFSITFPEAEMYWLSAAVRDEKASIPGARRNVSYNGILEVQQP
jgi:hypothetical protein